MVAMACGGFLGVKWGGDMDDYMDEIAKIIGREIKETVKATFDAAKVRVFLRSGGGFLITLANTEFSDVFEKDFYLSVSNMDHVFVGTDDDLTRSIIADELQLIVDKLRNKAR